MTACVRELRLEAHNIVLSLLSTISAFWDCHLDKPIFKSVFLRRLSSTLQFRISVYSEKCKMKYFTTGLFCSLQTATLLVATFSVLTNGITMLGLGLKTHIEEQHFLGESDELNVQQTCLRIVFLQKVKRIWLWIVHDLSTSRNFVLHFWMYCRMFPSFMEWLVAGQS